jgi:hypothetical protein
MHVKVQKDIISQTGVVLSSINVTENQNKQDRFETGLIILAPETWLANNEKWEESIFVSVKSS